MKYIKKVRSLLFCTCLGLSSLAFAQEGIHPDLIEVKVNPKSQLSQECEDLEVFINGKMQFAETRWNRVGEGGAKTQCVEIKTKFDKVLTEARTTGKYIVFKKGELRLVDAPKNAPQQTIINAIAQKLRRVEAELAECQGKGKLIEENSKSEAGHSPR